MRITRLKHDRPYHKTPNNFHRIISFTEGNNFYRIINEIVTSSSTGKKCVEMYSKFISGLGVDEEFIVNRKNQTLNELIKLISKDLAMYGGFALHINTNGLGEIVETQHVPIDFIRLSSEDQHKVWLFDRWDRLNISRLYKFEMEKPIEFELYDKNKVFSENGFIYYYSNQGFGNYPLPIYYPSLTDMNTEEGVSNVLNRNARNNFFSAGFLVNYLSNSESEEQFNEISQTIQKFQGDENSLNIGYIECKSREEKPEFIELGGKNLDHEFDSTIKIIKSKIGESFSQPPILRGEDVGSNFGSDALVNAYNFYNLITQPERDIIEFTIKYLFDQDLKINKLNYLV